MKLRLPSRGLLLEMVLLAAIVVGLAYLETRHPRVVPGGADAGAGRAE